ncbi:MAG: carboxypeptidase regulatory-like domain-containing protein [Bryobacteraceae bacterium]
MTSVRAAVLIWIGTGISAWAQVTGSISGSVLDPQGKAIPQAKVSLLRPSGQEPLFETTTQENGTFTIESVNPQIYNISIEAQGFAPFQVQNVTVSPGVPAVLRNLTLQVAGVVAVVETSARAEAVAITTSQVSATLTNAQLQLLPQLLRDPLQLLQTQAGVSNNNGITTINGLRPSFQNVTLDGINIQDNYYRARSLNYLPNRLFLDQISEFTLITSNQTSAYGNGAAQVAFATPSGSNAFHGDLFYLASPSGISANEWFNNFYGSGKAYKRNQGGATVAGPIKKDKLFFFTNYELVRSSDGVLTETYSPTAGFRNTVSNPALQSVLGTLPLPNIALDQVSNPGLGLARYQLRQNQNLDNVTGKLDLFASRRNVFYASYVWNHERADDPYPSNFVPSTTLRTDDDRNLGALSWRTTLRPNLINELRFGVDDLPITFSRPAGRASQYLALIAGNRDCQFLLVGSQFSVGQICAAALNLGLDRFGLQQFKPSSGPSNANPIVPSAQNLLPNDQGSARWSRTYSLQESLSWTHNRHSMQFGFQSQTVRTSREDFTATGPLLGVSFFPGASGDVLYQSQSIDLQHGSSPGYVLGSPQTYRFAYNRFAFFGHDAFRVSPRLTVTAGLRYELNRAVHDMQGEYLAPLSQNVTGALFDPNAEYGFTSGDIYKPSKRNFAPNIGLAFDPFGRGTSVVRAGYSITYVNDDIIRAAEGTQFDSSLGGQSVVDQFLPTPYPQLGSALPSLSAPPLSGPITASNLANSSYGNPYWYTSASVVDPRLRTPYVQEWNFDLQQQWRGTLFDLRYVGNRSVGMLRQVNLNQMNLRDSGFLPDLIAVQSALRIGSALPSNRLTNVIFSPSTISQNSALFLDSTQTGYIAWLAAQDPTFASGYPIYANSAAQAGATIVGNFSHSSYHALQFDVRHRFNAGLQFQINYTWSKVISDSASLGSYKFEPYRNASNPGLDRAPAPFDVRHAIKANFFYDLPFAKHASNGFLRKAIAGWSVTGIVLLQSGSPFSIFSNAFSADYNPNFPIAPTTADAVVSGGALNQLFGIRQTGSGPRFIASSALSPNGGASSSVFANPSSGQVGTLQPRSFYGPWVTDTNLGVQKTMRLTERQSLQFRGEAINAFNHASWYVPELLPSSSLNPALNINSRPQFGQVLYTFYPARKIQLTLFYRF